MKIAQKKKNIAQMNANFFKKLANTPCLLHTTNYYLLTVVILLTEVKVGI